MSPRWSQAELDLLIEHYPRAGIAGVQQHVGRSKRAIQLKAQEMALRTNLHERRPRWSEADDAVLLAHYKTRGGAYVAGILRRSVGACQKRYYILTRASRPKPQPGPTPAPAQTPAGPKGWGYA